MADRDMSADEVRLVASLVKLELTEAEIEKYRETIPQTLDVISILRELDTSKAIPTSSVTGLSNVYADDSVEASLPQDLALSNAHESEKGLFITKAVFDRS